MSITTVPLKNPYPEKFRDLNNKFVRLLANLQKRTYTRRFLNLPSNFYTSIAFVTFCSYLVALFSAMGLLIPGESIRLEPLYISLVFAGISTLFWLLLWRTESAVRASDKIKIDQFADSIPAEMMVELTVCLRDLHCSDPIMSQHAQHKVGGEEVPRRLALYMISHPNSINTLKACEYLFAEYVSSHEYHVSDDGNSLLGTTESNHQTYYGYLRDVERKDLASRNERTLADEMKVAEMKLTSLESKLSSSAS